jgi:TonB family protein
MKRLLVFFFLTTFAIIALAKDPAPFLKSAAMPFYPPLARQARIEGEVRLRFHINEQGSTEKIDVLSGHPMLKHAAVENIGTWKFGWPNPCSCNVEQEAVLVYKLADERTKPVSRKATVTWLENYHIEIEADPAPIIMDSTAVQ